MSRAPGRIESRPRLRTEWRRLPGALLFAAALLLVVPPPLAAQEAPPDDAEEPAVALTARGSASFAAGVSDPIAIPFAETAAGPLFALEPIVARLGGHLETGPLGASYTLTLGAASLLLAPGSVALTAGTEILPLSQAPLVLDGALVVPLDLLERSFGAQLGVRFEWQGAARHLAAIRSPARDLPVEVDLVHLQGITTVVLQFPEPPRFRVERRGDAYEVIFAGDRALPPAPRERPADPLVRRVLVAQDRVRVELAPGSAADQYTLQNPFRIVFDVYRAAEPVAGAPAPGGGLPPGPARERRGIRTVVVDPGHGGKETGAIGPSGAAEKELTLAIAQALATRLEQALRVQAVLTRTDDLDLGLDERSALANQYRADLFVSIHLNSTARRTGARGAETYFLSLQASDERAAAAAAVENAPGAGAPAAYFEGAAGAPPTEEFDLRLLLWDLAQSQHLAASQRLATLIQEELNSALDLRDRGVKQAPFRVLMGAAMPAVLVELGFLSNPEEEARLRDPDYRSALVETLVRAIGRYKSEIDGSTAGAAP
jgi:N-acetylmuramoyl-L-alanine amidase